MYCPPAGHPHVIVGDTARPEIFQVTGQLYRPGNATSLAVHGVHPSLFPPDIFTDAGSAASSLLPLSFAKGAMPLLHPWKMIQSAAGSGAASTWLPSAVVSSSEPPGVISEP